MTTLSEFLAEHVDHYTATLEHYAYSLPQNALRFESMAKLKFAVSESGSHYFDRDTLRFWSATTAPRLYRGRVFVESVCYPDGPRFWRVSWVVGPWRAGACLTVEHVDTHFPSYADARAAARVLAGLLP